MSNLKRFNDYIKEKDQHREKSDKEVILDKEIEDVHSDEVEVDVDNKTDNDTDNSEISVEDVAKLSEVNEGAVKRLSYDIQEILKEMMDESIDSYLASTNNAKNSDNGDDGDHIEYNMDEISKRYTDKVLELLNGSNESLTEKEDVDQDIIESDKEKRSEKSKDELEKETKDVFYSTNQVDKEIEQNKEVNESKVATDESPLGYYLTCNALSPKMFFEKLEEKGIEYKHDTYANFIEVFVKDIDEAKYAREIALDMDVFEVDDIESDDLPYIKEDGPGDMMEIKMVKLNENESDDEDFVINPDSEDFKLMKKIVGEKADYTTLRKVLKESFPGWEGHTESILETWGLIKTR
jgi:hypothetical protein